jgi:hypothetical protein
MKLPIHLQTKFGLDLYNIIVKQYNDYMKQGKDTDFRLVMRQQRIKVDRELSHFLNDKESEKSHKMDDADSEGWNLYKQLADKYTILHYFETRKTCL